MPPRFSRELYEKVIFPDTQGYQPRTSPCEVHCPAGNPVQKVHALIRESRVEEALEYLMARNPFPGVTGRVCPHPCEARCNRNEYDEGVFIRGLERFAADHADLARVGRPKVGEKTGKTLARQAPVIARERAGETGSQVSIHVFPGLGSRSTRRPHG